MGLKLGPILSFRGLEGDTEKQWRVSVLVVRDITGHIPRCESAQASMAV